MLLITFLVSILFSSCAFSYPRFNVTLEESKPFEKLNLEFLLELIDKRSPRTKFDWLYPTIPVNYYWLKIQRADDKSQLRTALQLVKESFLIQTPDTAIIRIPSEIKQVQTIGDNKNVWILAGPIVIPRAYKGDFTMRFKMTYLNMTPPFTRDTADIVLQARYEKVKRIFPTRHWIDTH